MSKHQATLIQDINEYLTLLEEYLTPLFEEHHALQGMSLEGVIQWIIEEELDIIYMLYTKGHAHGLWPYHMFHAELDRRMRLSLSTYTGHYIRAPRLYDDSDIKLYIRGRDLYIEYYCNPIMPPVIQ